jgi:hypothetical protein
MRRKLVPVVAMTMACLLLATTACSTGNSKKRSRSSGTTTSKRVDVDSTATATTATPRAGDQLSCVRLRDARVGSGKVRYQKYATPLRLTSGSWSGQDGATVELQQPCAIGDLDGDGAGDAVGAVVLDKARTERFFTLAAWRNVKGQPEYLAQADLGDRTPVQSISVHNGRVTVVYLTRTANSPMTKLNLRRTAIYQRKGALLVKLSHTDTKINGDVSDYYYDDASDGTDDAVDSSGGSTDSDTDSTTTRRRKSRSR